MICILRSAMFLLLAVPGVALAQQPRSPLVASFESYQSMKRDTRFGMQWIGLGPVVNSARVEAVQLDPSQPGVMYVAFGSGNLWKTVNHGVSWRPLFEDQASHGIGDIALAPSNPEIIYVGTGESLKKARNFTIPGTGIYRSDDGGEQWRHLGLSDSWHIGEIAVHPENPDVVVVAVLGHFWSSNPNRGLYRTEDGGQTWQHVLAIDQNTGANDVVWARDNPDVVYASMWENFPEVSGPNSSIHKSTDAGVTWQKCEQGLPNGEQVGRIGLAVSQTDSDKVYALIDNRERIGNRGAAQVFKSVDGGKNWQQSHEQDLMISSRIGWYFADIYVNPQDDEEIFALGVRVAHSTDGGRHFDLLGGKVAHLNPSAASGLHLDHCEMWINPVHPHHIVLGNDGGLYESHDKGQSWIHYNNLPTGEFYDIEVDQADGTVYAGAQDNATVFGPAREFDPNVPDRWKYLWIDPWNGGDGCVTRVDPEDSNTVYFSAQEGAFRRKDRLSNRSKGIRPRLPDGHDGQLAFNFVAPMIISPHDHKTLYLGGNFLFKSVDQGDHWEVVSPDLSISKDEQRQSTATATIAESGQVPGLLYVGTDQGLVWVSEDGGEHWEDRSHSLPRGYVRSICPSAYSESRVYVAITGINDDDLETYLFCSDDRGVTWRSISANLAGEPANVILEDPVHEDILYAGLFRGVSISLDRGKSWSLLGSNLPACSVADLEVYRQSNDLVIGTHGRGIYKVNLDPLHELYEQKLEVAERDYLFPIPIAKRPYLSDTRPSTNFRRFEKTPISFWLQRPGAVTVSVINQADETLAAFELEGRQGLNQFRWDLQTESTPSDAPYFIEYKKYLPAGEYEIQIESRDSVNLKRAFRVEDGSRDD